MAKTKQNKKTETEKGVDPTLDFVMKRFNASRDYAKKYYWDVWNNCWKLYNNERVEANYEGNSDGFVPETFTIIQAVKAHIVGPDMKTVFLPFTPDQTGDTDTLNALFDFAWYQDNTDEKVDSAIQDYLVDGNGYLFQYLGEDKLPKNRYVATQDAFFDPDAVSYYSMGYCGYRYTTSIDKLNSEYVTNENYDQNDPKSTIKVKRYKDLQDIQPVKAGENEDKTAKELREEMMGGSISKSEDNVECIVYFDKERMITVANRTVVIEEVKTPFQREAKTMMSADDEGNEVEIQIPAIKPFLPFAPFRNYKDGALWYAKGEVEYISELQERLNDTQNQKTDNLSFILNRMWTLDPAYASKIDEIQSIPGAVFTVPPGALEDVKVTPIGSDADNEIYRIKDEMRRATAADEIIQGASQDKGDITATEATIQIQQAGTRFQGKLNALEDEGFRILANNMFKLLQIYVDKEMAIRTVGPKGIEWKTYNPGEFLGDWDVKVMLKGNAQKIKEEEKQNAMQFYLLASKQPFINQPMLFEMVASTLFDKDKEEVKALIMPPNPNAAKEQAKVNISLRGELPQNMSKVIAASELTPEDAGEEQGPQPGGGTVDASQAPEVANIPGIPQA